MDILSTQQHGTPMSLTINMSQTFVRRLVIGIGLLAATTAPSLAEDRQPSLATAREVLEGLRDFYAKTARDDGSFSPGIDPDYRGMSDSAYSDMAAVTYAVVLHRTFGWKLPHDPQTAEF